MVTDSAIEIMRRRIGDEIEGELGQFIDSIGCASKPSLILFIQRDLPSLGSATARDTFFSSLIESNNPDNRGVTFPSTRAAACSSAMSFQHHYRSVRCL